jgi:hypothetical protein
MVIVEISAESVKACSFHQRKSIPDTEIIYSSRDFDTRVKLIYFSQFTDNMKTEYM